MLSERVAATGPRWQNFERVCEAVRIERFSHEILSRHVVSAKQHSHIVAFFEPDAVLPTQHPARLDRSRNYCPSSSLHSFEHPFLVSVVGQDGVEISVPCVEDVDGDQVIGICNLVNLFEDLNKLPRGTDVSCGSSPA